MTGDGSGPLWRPFERWEEARMRLLESVCVILTCLLAACGTEVCEPDPPEEVVPNGYCESDEDCAETDFCLPEWCDGPCRPMERCFLRVPEGEWCNRSRMCKDGLRCSSSDEFDAGECAP